MVSSSGRLPKWNLPKWHVSRNPAKANEILALISRIEYYVASYLTVSAFMKNREILLQHIVFAVNI
jgi:hypothetical protein